MLGKIKPEQMEQYGVVSAPDHLSGNPADVKAIFDRLVKELVAVVVNDIIDAHNGLDEDVNQRIDEVIEELKNVSEINAENLGAQNIALDKKGETTLADQYNTGELAPTVHGALLAALKKFVSKTGDTMTGTLSFNPTGHAKQKGKVYKNATTSTDYGTKLEDVDIDGDIAVLRVSAESEDMFFQTIVDGAYSASNRVLHTGNKSLITPADIGAVNKAGDTMTGDLSIEKLFPVFRLKSTQSGRTAEFNMGGDSYTSVYNRKDDKNYQGFYIPPETAATRMQVVRCVNGEKSVTEVLHTRNLEVLNMARIVSGSYTGTGEATKTLTFPFTPKLVYVSVLEQSMAHGHVLVVNGMEQAFNSFYDKQSTIGDRKTKLSWSEKALTLLADPSDSYDPKPHAAMNSSNTKYFYIAIG